MNGLGLTILIFMLIFSWWQWAEKDKYRDLYYSSLAKKPTEESKKLPETKEEEECLGIEYDDKLPHPFK